MKFQYNNKIHGYVIMPNHIHLLLYVSLDSPKLSGLIQNAKLFEEKLNYIHNNPCTHKWRLAEKPEDYVHSSASNYITGAGIYDVEIIC